MFKGGKHSLLISPEGSAEHKANIPGVKGLSLWSNADFPTTLSNSVILIFEYLYYLMNEHSVTCKCTFFFVCFSSSTQSDGQLTWL